ncbi:hypothetical protein GCM10017691_31810 [Pseudonocardia petroleophila]|uniref:Proprotein convertase P-domain-containing protein n=1 Tax=Pseudonocardia petroleophila TaxID=37331 RepID=A0A7G7MDY5_9PSEU|nr:proprotein convertase P-domain-containing protein [Pseudonocardia petroleophila]QNG50996.1 proprotein convertase P-domain-containing protein [Pseudonocardia petroleophila]
MTDPTGPPPPGWNQGGWSTAGPVPGGGQDAGGHPETAQHPGAGQYPGAAQHPSDPHHRPSVDPDRYPETAHYPSGAPYPGSPYPGGQHPGGPYGDQGGQQAGPYGPYGGPQQPGGPYPGQGGWNAAYAAPSPAPGRGRRTGIVVAAVVASVAIVAAVVVVVLLNRSPDPNAPFAQGASTTALQIPDNTPGGATSTITLDGDARVGRIDVAMDLTHPYPGELTGVLTSPEGRQAVVFARAGTGGRVTLSTTEASSPLANLLGGPVAGAWALTFSDEVSADAGTLNSWDITVYPAASDAPAPSAQPAQGTSDPALAIPDDDEFFGVTDVVDLGGYGTVDRMVVDVALTHQVSSDLRIELRSPLGRTVVLSDAEAGLATAGRIALNLDSSAPGSPLAALVGEPVAGPWQLRVYDTVVIDTGTLDGWDITVNG